MGILDFFTSKKGSEKTTLLFNMLAVAAADGKIDESEMAVIGTIAEQMGMTKQDVDLVVNDSGKMKLIFPKDPQEKELHMRAYISVLLVDGVINEVEHGLCLKLGQALGFSTRIVNTMIDTAIKRVLESQKENQKCPKPMGFRMSGDAKKE